MVASLLQGPGIKLGNKKNGHHWTDLP